VVPPWALSDESSPPQGAPGAGPIQGRGALGRKAAAFGLKKKLLLWVGPLAVGLDQFHQAVVGFGFGHAFFDDVFADVEVDVTR
jgi:hypothetical protein